MLHICTVQRYTHTHHIAHNTHSAKRLPQAPVDQVQRLQEAVALRVHAAAHMCRVLQFCAVAVIVLQFCVMGVIVHMLPLTNWEESRARRSLRVA